MSTLITREASEYTDEQRRLITDVLCKGATPQEVSFFMEYAKRVNLDPFKKQIYAIKRWDSSQKREVLQFQMGIDGLRSVAARCKTDDGKDAYAGSSKPIYYYNDKGNIESCEVTVQKMVQGQARAFTAEVFWDECVQTNREGAPNSFWQKRPKGQIGKCAEAAALRKAFPEETGGIYIDEEGPSVQELAPAKSTRQVTDEVILERITRWGQLLPDRWRDVKVEGMEGDMLSVNAIVYDQDDKLFAKLLPAEDCPERHAMFCGYYVRYIESGLHKVQMTVADMDQHLRTKGVLADGKSILECPGEELEQLRKTIREAMKKTKAEKPAEEQ